jgi:hypothetical protein
MIHIVAEQMAQALELPLFRTVWFLPDYPDGEIGLWRLSHTGVGIDHGYYTRQWIISGMPVLLRRSAGNPELWEPWMSLSPHEIESQEPGCLHAVGHTVIMGLGMGWIALNAALNPNVRRVTVVELDREVIELFASTGVMDQVPPDIAEKVVVVHADALEWRPDEAVDFLYADIWRSIADAGALADMQRMQQNVRATGVYFWGQELRFFSAALHRYGPDEPLTVIQLSACATDDLQLPLVLPWGDEYGSRIMTAVGNRRSRGLPMEEKG